MVLIIPKLKLLHLIAIAAALSVSTRHGVAGEAAAIKAAVVNERATLLPGGVADPSGKTGYVTNSQGGIDAIDLETGKTLWSTAEAETPLFAFKNQLVAMTGKGNSVRILVFDARQDVKRLLESEPVVFPDWVSVQDAWGHTFTSQAYLRDGDLLLRWEAHAHYAGGAAPSEEILEAAKKDGSGVARIDLKTGHVETQAPESLPSFASSPRAARQDMHSQQYWQNGNCLTTPLVVGDMIVALELVPVDKTQPNGRQQLILKRWLGSGRKLSSRLMQGSALWLAVTLNSNYVFVHQELPPDALPPGDNAWWVFSLESGQQVAKLPFDTVAGPVAIIGSRVYSIVSDQIEKMSPFGGATIPRSLRAVDLKTGRQLWQHAVKPEQQLALPM